MTAQLSPPFWKDVGGLGDWVSVADLVRVAGFTAGNTATRWARALQEEGARVQRLGDSDTSLLMVHRDDMHLLQNVLAQSMAQRLRRAGPHRQELFNAIDSPEFEGMDLYEILHELALRPDLVASALADMNGEET